MAEKKIFDSIPPSDLAPDKDGKIVPLTEIPQGFLDTQRIGDKVTGSSLRVMWTSFPRAQNGVPTVKETSKPLFKIRCIIFIWKDDTAPTIAQLLELNDTTEEGKYMNPLNHDQKVKRKILLDETFRAAATFRGPDATDGYVLDGVWNAPLVYTNTFDLTKLKGGLNTINYQGGTATGVNNIYMAFITNGLVSGTVNSTWSCFYNCRYTFIDM